MTIHRSGPTPPFFDYICNYALIPTNPASPHLGTLMGPGQRIDWVDIPSFQRGISWDIEKVKELLDSKSVLLGNAILSQHAVQGGQFPHLSPSDTQYLVLVDGLQRLAVGTSLLWALHSEVLVPTPIRPADAVHFTALAARAYPLSAYYLHNDLEFSSHRRQAVRDQYITLRKSIKDYCEQELASGRAARLASTIVPLFLTRQLALDIYFNFNRIELLSTFIGINTVRVDLGPVDLLRASILEQATIAGWAQSDLEAIENQFTETFTFDEKPKQDFMPFVNAALKAIDNGHGTRLFPSWGPTLQKADVDTFLDFVDEFESSIANNAFLKEIKLCGKLPVSIVFAYYYLDVLHGSKAKPSFFIKGTAEDAALHAFLVTCYRLLLDGSVGRTSGELEGLVDGSLVNTLSGLANDLSLKFVGRGVAATLDHQWLETHVNQIDKKRAPRIFNALLLPVKTSLGAAFSPITFGRAAMGFHVDHLIPEALLQLQAPGGLEGQTLRNFAPLPTNQNRVAKATNCSSKLSVGGIYDQYVNTSTTHQIHPYSRWLLTTTGVPNGAVLDNQANLEKNSTPDVGTQRITEIVTGLLPRI